MALYFVIHLWFTGFLPKAEKHQSTPTVCITYEMYNGSTGLCTLMRRESSDQRVVKTNKTNNEHKIDLFTSATLVSSGALATGSSNFHRRQMLSSAATVGLKENSSKTSFPFLLLSLLRCNSRSSTHKTTLKAV